MKKLLFLFLLLPFLGNSQATFTAPVGYNTGAPTATPSGVGTRWRFDLLTGKKYTWLPGSMSWDEDARGIDQVAGCSAPLYTPGYNQSTFAVNSCTVPELYQWTGAAWVRLNEGEVYTAGAGISIDGSNVISNTAPNVVQELSIAGQDLNLSNGGGTVAIPGVSWPLLAPDGEAAAPSYSFENFLQTGLFMGGRGIVLRGGDSREITIVTEDHTDDGGDKITIKTGSSDTEPGGDLIIVTGNSNSQNAGSINIALGSGTTGGNLIVTSGNGTVLAGDVTFQGGTGVGCDGGSFYMVGGTSDTDSGGSVNISAGIGGTDGQRGRVILNGNGVLLPSVTTAQRDAFTVVAAGMVIYNTDANATDSSTGVMQVWNGSVWKNAW